MNYSILNIMKHILYSHPPHRCKCCLFICFFLGGLHKTLLQITPPKILEKTCCHFWVRNNAVGLWCCRWGHGCYDTSLHAAASSSSASCQSWMAWKRATSRLAPKPHGKMTWDIYFKICSNVPTPCEKNLVQYYQKYVLFFWSHWLQTSPCFSRTLQK